MRLSVTVLLYHLCSIVSAIYADEASHLDHHLALLGPPQRHATFFHRPSAGSAASLLYTLSEDGLLGAVNPRDGNLLWRRDVASGRRKNYRGILKNGLASNVIACVADDILQVFDAVDGRLIWNWQSTGAIRAIEVLSGLQEPGIAILEHCGGAEIVRHLSLNSGDEQWQYRDASGDLGHSISHEGNTLFYVALHPSLLKGYKIKRTRLAVLNGHEEGQAQTLSADGEVSSVDSILYAGHVGSLPVIIWADKSLRAVKLLSVSHFEVSTLPLGLEDKFKVRNATVTAPDDLQANPDFILHLQAEAEYTARIYHLDQTNGKLAITQKTQVLDGRGAFSVSTHGAAVYFLQHSREEVSLISSKTAAVIQKWPLKSQSVGIVGADNPVVFAVAEIAPKSDSKFSMRYAQLLVSGDWEMIVNGESTWLRTEGLTGVLAAAFADIMDDEILAADLPIERRANALYACYHRVKRHLNAVRTIPAWFAAQYNNFVGITSQLVGTNGAPSNRFGFGKMIILVTERGRVSALLSNQKARVLWNTHLLNPTRASVLNKARVQIFDNMAVVITDDGEVHHLHMADGELVSAGKVSSIRPDILPALSMGMKPEDLQSAVLNSLLPIDSSPRVVVSRSTHGQRLTAYLLSRESEQRLVWEWAAPAGEAIVDVVHRPSHDPVASIGQVLGDRSVLYKYIDCNILTVICKDSAADKISFHVLNAASGSLLYSTSRFDIDLQQPISASVSENTFAWSAFSTAGESTQHGERKDFAGYQLTIGEMYESSRPNERAELLGTSALLKEAYNRTDRLDTALPYVITQSFLIPEPLSHLAFTTTRQGITPRTLLGVTSHSNSLISIPRPFLDPRRPTGRDPNAAEVEEGLFRSYGILDFDPKWVLSHEQESLGFSKLITEPSSLESTSLVFAFGDYDLFATRTSPIGGFDMLGKSFSKIQLAATVSALAIATVLLGPMVRRKQVDGTWKT